jgi:hypothetical protein
MVANFKDWKEKLLLYGRIVQDGDSTVTPEEAERRFNRYIEILEELDGTEGEEVLAALFQSIQVEHDYGAYQTLWHTMARFPEDQFFTVLVNRLPTLIKQLPDWAGDILVGIANGQDTKWEYQIQIFNDAVINTSAANRELIIEYIRVQEESGWFRHRVGVLCP